MVQYNDVYGIRKFKEKNRLEIERQEKNTQLMEQVLNEVKKISQKIGAR